MVRKGIVELPVEVDPVYPSGHPPSRPFPPKSCSFAALFAHAPSVTRMERRPDCLRVVVRDHGTDGPDLAFDRGERFHYASAVVAEDVGPHVGGAGGETGDVAAAGAQVGTREPVRCER